MIADIVKQVTPKKIVSGGKYVDFLLDFRVVSAQRPNSRNPLYTIGLSNVSDAARQWFNLMSKWNVHIDMKEGDDGFAVEFWEFDEDRVEMVRELILVTGRYRSRPDIANF